MILENNFGAEAVILDKEMPFLEATEASGIAEAFKYEQNTAATFPNTPQSSKELQSRADFAAYATAAKESEPCKSSAKTETTKVLRESLSSAAASAALSGSTDGKCSIEERKERTRKLINMGGLIVKAELEILPSNTLYGGLLTLRNQLIGKSREEMYKVIDRWTYLGKQQFEKEMRKGYCIALKFNFVPPREMLDKLKALGLKWNGLRKEWEGLVADIDILKTELGSADYSMQTL